VKGKDLPQPQGSASKKRSSEESEQDQDRPTKKVKVEDPVKIDVTRLFLASGNSKTLMTNTVSEKDFR